MIQWSLGCRDVVRREGFEGRVLWFKGLGIFGLGGLGFRVRGEGVWELQIQDLGSEVRYLEG